MLGENFFQYGLVKTTAAMFVRTALNREPGRFVLIIKPLHLLAGGTRIIMDDQVNGQNARVVLKTLKSYRGFG